MLITSHSQVYLKLENLQPSGSFKSRGIGQMMLSSLRTLSSPNSASTSPVHFYCSSGGNAGLACAHAAISLKHPATIVVPILTSALMITKIKALGDSIQVVVHGASWFDADEYMRKELLANDPGGVYIPPFDHPEVWKGNSTMIEEIYADIGGFDGVICSVGGGGLFNGIVQGLAELPFETKVLAVETRGGDCLFQSLKMGRSVRLDGITTIATSLGAVQVSNKTFELASGEYGRTVDSLVFDDAAAVEACAKFLDEERFLVEPACGVSLAPVYRDNLRTTIFGKDSVTGDWNGDEEWTTKKIVVVVCGGSNITAGILESYKDRFGVK